MRWLFWPLVALTAIFFVGMAGWSAFAISAEAGWELLFDARILGYGLDEARAFLTALSDQGLARYLGFQRLLDGVFPGLLAVCLIWGACRFHDWKPAIGFSLVAFVAAGLDYTENAAIAELLRAGPDGIDAGMVTWASRLTVLKWASYGVALSGFAWGWWAEWRRARAA